MFLRSCNDLEALMRVIISPKFSVDQSFFTTKLLMMYSSHSSKRWVLDTEAEHCQRCNGEFGILNRKHHCRACGHLLCEVCCATYMLIPKDKLMSAPGLLTDFTVPHRCCTACSYDLKAVQEDLREKSSKANTIIHFDKNSMDSQFNTPVSLKLQTDIRKAAYTIYNFISGEDHIGEIGKIPKTLIEGCKGLVFVTILKVGMVFTGRIGTGLVVARLDDGTWSAPSAIALSGLGWGFQFGGELTDVIIVLNTQEAVNAFMAKTQVSIGTELAVSAGVGRSGGADMSAGMKGAAAAVSYAHSKGLFFGVSLEASVIACRPDVNRDFYGQDIKPTALLSGLQPRPTAAEPLYKALEEILKA